MKLLRDLAPWLVFICALPFAWSTHQWRQRALRAERLVAAYKQDTLVLKTQIKLLEIRIQALSRPTVKSTGIPITPDQIEASEDEETP
jgi:hypothetical protein